MIKKVQDYIVFVTSFLTVAGIDELTYLLLNVFTLGQLSVHQKGRPLNEVNTQIELAEPVEMTTYTAFCQSADGTGTIWIECVTVAADASYEEAALAAREACAEAWEVGACDVHCLGLAAGDVNIAHWEDLND